MVSGSRRPESGCAKKMGVVAVNVVEKRNARADEPLDGSKVPSAGAAHKTLTRGECRTNSGGASRQRGRTQVAQRIKSHTSASPRAGPMAAQRSTAEVKGGGADTTEGWARRASATWLHPITTYPIW